MKADEIIPLSWADHCTIPVPTPLLVEGWVLAEVHWCTRLALEPRACCTEAILDECLRSVQCKSVPVVESKVPAVCALLFDV
jgi:hypothetical protein